MVEVFPEDDPPPPCMVNPLLLTIYEDLLLKKNKKRRDPLNWGPYEFEAKRWPPPPVGDM